MLEQGEEDGKTNRKKEIPRERMNVEQLSSEVGRF
jgi:hypothetical protein